MAEANITNRYPLFFRLTASFTYLSLELSSLQITDLRPHESVLSRPVVRPLIAIGSHGICDARIDNNKEVGKDITCPNSEPDQELLSLV
jgi:hypothetical protein